MVSVISITQERGSERDGLWIKEQDTSGRRVGFYAWPGDPLRARPFLPLSVRFFPRPFYNRITIRLVPYRNLPTHTSTVGSCHTETRDVYIVHTTVHVQIGRRPTPNPLTTLGRAYSIRCATTKRMLKCRHVQDAMSRQKPL